MNLPQATTREWVGRVGAGVRGGREGGREGGQRKEPGRILEKGGGRGKIFVLMRIQY